MYFMAKSKGPVHATLARWCNHVEAFIHAAGEGFLHPSQSDLMAAHSSFPGPLFRPQNTLGTELCWYFSPSCTDLLHLGNGQVIFHHYLRSVGLSQRLWRKVTVELRSSFPEEASRGPPESEKCLAGKLRIMQLKI